MKMDASVDKFALDPTQYLLKIEGNVIKAERKGLLTWVKAHFPLAIFGDYKLQRVVSLIDKDASEQLKRSINNAIFRFNLVHPESRLSFIEFAPKQPHEALKLPEPFSQPEEEVNPSLIRKLENETPPAEVRNVQENMLAKAIETPLPESPATPKPSHKEQEENLASFREFINQGKLDEAHKLLDDIFEKAIETPLPESPPASPRLPRNDLKEEPAHLPSATDQDNSHNADIREDIFAKAIETPLPESPPATPKQPRKESKEIDALQILINEGDFDEAHMLLDKLVQENNPAAKERLEALTLELKEFEDAFNKLGSENGETEELQQEPPASIPQPPALAASPKPEQRPRIRQEDIGGEMVMERRRPEKQKQEEQVETAPNPFTKEKEQADWAAIDFMKLDDAQDKISLLKSILERDSSKEEYWVAYGKELMRAGQFLEAKNAFVQAYGKNKNVEIKALYQQAAARLDSERAKVLATVDTEDLAVRAAPLDEAKYKALLKAGDVEMLQQEPPASIPQPPALAASPKPEQRPRIRQEDIGGEMVMERRRPEKQKQEEQVETAPNPFTKEKEQADWAAIDFMKLDDAQDKISLLKSILERDSSKEEYWVAYGKELMRAGQFLEAKDAFVQAYRKNKNVEIKALYQQAAARLESERAKVLVTVDTEDLAVRAAPLDEAKYKALLEAGDVEMKNVQTTWIQRWNLSGYRQKAIDAYREAYQMRPLVFGEYINNLIDLYFQHGDSRSAASLYEEVREKFPDATVKIRPDAYLDLAKLANRAEKITIYEKLYILEKTDANWTLLRSAAIEYAQFLRKENKMKEAYQVLTDAREWHPNDEVLLEEFRQHHTKEAMDLVKEGRFDDAVARIQQALDLIGKTSAEDYLNLAKINLQRGKKEEAVRQLKEAARLGLQNRDVFYLLSKETKGDERLNYLKAAHNLDKGSQEFAKEYFDAIYERAKAQFLQGDPIQAENDLKVALELAKSYKKLTHALPAVLDASFKVHMVIGQCAYGVMNWQEAIRAYRLALAYRPQDPELLANLGKCYLRFDMKQEAMECFKSSLAIRDSQDVLRVVDASTKSVEELEEFVSKFPEASHYKIELIYRLIVLRRIDEAAAHARSLVASNPASAESKLLLADVLRRQDNNECLSVLQSLYQEEAGPLRYAVINQYYNTLIERADKLTAETKSWLPYILRARGKECLRAAGMYEKAKELLPNRYGSYLNSYIDALVRGGEVRRAGELYDILRDQFPASDIHMDSQALMQLATIENSEDRLAFSIRLHEQDPTQENLDKLCRAYVQFAKTLKERGEYDKALVLMKKALELKPNDAKLLSTLRKFHRLRANIFIQKGQLKAALAEMNHTLLAWMRPGVEDYRLLATIYGLLKQTDQEAEYLLLAAKMEGATADDYMKALQLTENPAERKVLLRRVHQMDPTRVDALKELFDVVSEEVSEAKDLTSYQEAARLADAYPELKPRLARLEADSELQLRIAREQAKKGKREEAIAAFLKAGELAGDRDLYKSEIIASNPELAVQDVRALMLQNKFQEAIRGCLELIAQFPQITFFRQELSNVYSDVGRAFLQKDNTAKAEEYFIKALECKVDAKASTYKALADLLGSRYEELDFRAKEVQLPQIFKLYKKACELDPQNGEYQFALGKFLYHKDVDNKYDNLPYVNKAVELDPNNITYLYGLIMSLRRRELPVNEYFARFKSLGGNIVNNYWEL